jgi:hypothetical protein
MSITIDSTLYDVNIKIVNRKPEFLFKYAERLENGDLKSEILGIYYNYDLECGMSAHNVSAYAALFLKLTEPTESHEVTIPGAPSGYETADYYFANVRDQVARYNKNGVDYFRSLTFSVIAISPARVPA